MLKRNLHLFQIFRKTRPVIILTNQRPGKKPVTFNGLKIFKEQNCLGNNYNVNTEARSKSALEAARRCRTARTIAKPRVAKITPARIKTATSELPTDDDPVDAA